MAAMWPIFSSPQNPEHLSPGEMRPDSIVVGSVAGARLAGAGPDRTAPEGTSNLIGSTDYPFVPPSRSCLLTFVSNFALALQIGSTRESPDYDVKGDRICFPRKEAELFLYRDETRKFSSGTV